MDEQRAILTAQGKAGGATRRRLLSLLGIAALLPARSFAASDREQDAGKHLLILGDSLSAEYGLGRGEGWVNLLAQRTAPKGWTITNASISGETTAGGLSRLPSLLSRHHPAVTVVELGANDALR